ncbi:TIGR04024 family LLM class F420-dependent oxidoreductase [Haloarcula salinisoli]|uniref:TIGR04024 family LLM class F420-dependent oxidoreductase n=1 Tax=Haloarcula salinisoli TaxID=2487746 RepID=A0A8J7YC23_9EURY|nr:TIGR04024 family LLM class F420-dependent oxidoreductase [Halomicroarcula salinisoli]MBX0285720.1 TIGR04024 family LLM class F420-dependent oxidoreductase [Halomicroarcula salinisoli]MBX0302792.1 TIGR04024 family LLM class F420-dependent oxidoreductase [Halomicroarcula salinisoli]
MTARDIYLPVAAQPSVSTLVGLSQLADVEGYERVWLPETWGRDAVTTLTSIAHGTDDVGIGTSLLNVYSRSPALIGQTAATLQEASDGRLRVGLGPSGPRVIEGWHGESFERPLRRTRETIDIVKQVLSGEAVEYDGDIFELSGLRLRSDPPDPVPPIDAGGLGPKAVELAGRFADGWHALLLTVEGMADRLDDFDRGAELGDRDRASQRVTFSVPCCALADRERARAMTRQHVAFYVGGMGTYYRDALARQGYEDTATTVFEQWNDGDREAAKAAIDDELLDALAVAGTPEECRDHIERFERIDGVDAINVSFPRAAERADIEATMAALAP